MVSKRGHTVNDVQKYRAIQRAIASAAKLDGLAAKGPLDPDGIRTAVAETASAIRELAEVLDVMAHSPIKGA